MLELPAQASSTEGDYISIVYLANAARSVKIGGPTGEFLCNGSLMIRRQPNSNTFQECTGGDKQYLTIDAIANGDGGEGTKIECYYNGTSWSLNAVIECKGDGSADSTSNFTVS